MSLVEPAYVPSIIPKGWVLPNYSSFSDWINATFSKVKSSSLSKKTNTPCSLFPHQKFVQNVIGSPFSPYHGMLIYHGLGTGKTITSISVAESLSRDREIIIMLPASLLQNYVDEIISCGNNVFTLNRHWYFIPNDKDTNKNASEIKKMKGLGVDSSFIRQNKGVWSYEESKDANYYKLDSEDQVIIKKQIRNMINNRYHFIHYNGIGIDKIKSYGRDFFNNKTIIIDEIHNFISAVKNDSKVRTVLYYLLMEADNVKIIGLSGTPMINDTGEMAFMANLLHGHICMNRLYFVVNNTFNKNIDKIRKVLEEHLYVDDFEIFQAKGIIDIRLVPPHFKRVSSSSHLVERQTNDYKTSKNASEQIQDVIEKITNRFQVNFIKHVLDKQLLLPEQENFTNYFVNSLDDFTYKNKSNKQSSLKNEKVLMRRLQSIISYYESLDETLFPSVNYNDIVVNMPDYVFEKYQIVRDKERRRERIALQKKNEDKSDPTQSDYKTFSRALCLFCFPEEIKRVYPGNLKEALKKETDDIDRVYQDSNTNSKSKSKSNSNSNSNSYANTRRANKTLYDQQLDEMINKLRKKAKVYLTGKNLEKYGIKYNEMMKKISNAPGSILIYSHFRQIEGLGIMKEVLNVNNYFHIDLINHKEKGWILDLPKDKKDWSKPFYFVRTQNKIKNKELLSIFNSDFDSLLPYIREQVIELLKYKQEHFKQKIDKNLRGDIIKCMMITQSGAEGITLKNVRQVHIFEPYWNPIRIKQVIGRAVRMNSHADLPKKDRTVDVYKYIMTLGENHKLEEDKNLTSDEVVENIAKRKEYQIKDMEKLLQKTSVDCEINKKIHKHIDSCYKVPKAFKKYAYIHGDKSLTEDIMDDEEDIKMKKTMIKKTVKSLVNKKTGKMIYYIQETDEIISPEDFEKDKTKKIIGFLENKDGKKIPRYY